MEAKKVRSLMISNGWIQAACAVFAANSSRAGKQLILRFGRPG